MSIVGLRPALISQKKLIEERKKYGIDLIKPGITGNAQINGRDLLTDEKNRIRTRLFKKSIFYL